MKKSIGFIAASLPPKAIGGMEIFNFYLLEGIAHQYDVTVFTTGSDTMSSHCKQVIVSSKLFGISGFRLRDLWFALNLLRALLLNGKNIDVYHVPFTSNSRYLAAVLGWYFRVTKQTYIAVIHGGGLKPWKPRWMYKGFFARAGRIVAVSEPIREEYRRRTNREIDLILPLIPFKQSGYPRDGIRASMSIEDDRFIILYLGSIKPIKGTIDIIEALGFLGEKYLGDRKITTIFVGDGPQKGDMKNRAKALGIDKYISFVGQVPFNEVNRYYELSDLYIISSQYEGTSKSLLGAMFFGLPIIGSDVRGINNILEHGKNGLLYKYGDSMDMAEKIKDMLGSAIRMDEYGKEARKTYLNGYSFAHTVQSFCRMYSGLLNQDSRE